MSTQENKFDWVKYLKETDEDLKNILKNQSAQDDLLLKYIKTSMEFTKCVIDMRAAQMEYDGLFYNGEGNITAALAKKELSEKMTDNALQSVIDVAHEIKDHYSSDNNKN